MVYIICHLSSAYEHICSLNTIIIWYFEIFFSTKTIHRFSVSCLSQKNTFLQNTKTHWNCTFDFDCLLNFVKQIIKHLYIISSGQMGSGDYPFLCPVSGMPKWYDWMNTFCAPKIHYTSALCVQTPHWTSIGGRCQAKRISCYNHNSSNNDVCIFLIIVAQMGLTKNLFIYVCLCVYKKRL